MWLSTIQSFKILRSIRENSESKSKERDEKKSVGEKNMTRKEGKRRNYPIPHYSNPKESAIFLCFQQNILVERDFNLKSIS